jgi:hypothetical protein
VSRAIFALFLVLQLACIALVLSGLLIHAAALSPLSTACAFTALYLRIGDKTK